MSNARLGNALSLYFVVAALTLSCGKDSPASGDLSFDEYVSAVFDANCQFFVSCRLLPDDSLCGTTFTANNALETIREDLRTGRVTFDAVIARQCLDALRGVVDACDVPTRLAAVPPSKCTAILVGHTESGHGCFYTEQCVPGSYCEQGDCTTADGQCCPGTCTSFHRDLAVGEPCGPHDTCAEGAYCRRGDPAQPGSCAPLLTVFGARCEDQQCAQPLFCDYDTLEPPFVRTCHRLVTTGADCSPGSRSGCADFRDRCDPVSNTCLRRGEIGASCESKLAVDRPCVGYASCDPATKTCRSLGGIGDPCDDAGGRRCMGNLICDATTATCRGPTPGKICAGS